MTKFPLYLDDDSWSYHEACAESSRIKAVYPTKDLKGQQLSADDFDEKWQSLKPSIHLKKHLLGAFLSSLSTVVG